MKARLASVVLASLGFLSSCKKPDATTKRTEIPTPDGPVAINSETLKATPQSITRVSEQDLVRFRALAEQAPAFLTGYIEAVNEPTLRDYDRAFQAWQDAKAPKHTRQEVIDILGCYLGERLIRDMSMEWVTVSDELGVAYAVRHTQREVISYPFSSVMKRIDDHTFNFLHNVYYAVEYQLKSGEAKLHEPL